jgi:hypothetical protein
VSARELVLSFQRDRWRACGDGVDVEHRELRGVEALLEAQLAGHEPVDIEIRFDMSVLPRWLHQFHGHYCNYTLRVPRRSARP